MTRNIFICIILLSAFFSSCEKDIVFKGKMTEPLLVLNSIITPDSIISVELTRSRFIIGELPPLSPVTDANVSLFVNGNLKEKLEYTDEGLYLSTYAPKSGDVIRLEAEANGFEPINALTVVPQKPSVIVSDSTVTFEEEVFQLDSPPNAIQKIKKRLTKVQLKLQDDAAQEDYYYIKATRTYYRESYIVDQKILDVALSEILRNDLTTNEDIVSELIDGEMSTDRIDNLFNDRFVNGKDILFNFSFLDNEDNSTYLNGEKIEFNERESFITIEYRVEIGAMTKDMYQYIISGNKADNSLDSPFAEPVIIPSNIKNGIGIFGAYNAYNFVIRYKIKESAYFFS